MCSLNLVLLRPHMAIVKPLFQLEQHAHALIIKELPFVNSPALLVCGITPRSQIYTTQKHLYSSHVFNRNTPKCLFNATEMMK